MNMNQKNQDFCISIPRQKRQDINLGESEEVIIKFL